MPDKPLVEPTPEPLAAPGPPRRVRFSRRTALRVLSLGALGGVSLVSLCVGQREPGGDPGRLVSGTFPTPTSNPARAAWPASTAPAKAGNPATIRFLSWWWTEPRRAAAWRSLVERFHAAQADVRVQEVAVPAAEYARTVLGGVATASLDADTLAFPDEIAVRLVRGRQLAQLDPSIERLGIRDRLDQSAQAVVMNAGRTYGLLASLTPSALVYNRELYAAAGIAAPPTTPDEYLDVAARATSRPARFGHAGWASLDEPARWWADLTQWVLAYGGTWAQAKQPLADSEPVLHAVRAYKTLYDRAMPRGSTGDPASTGGRGPTSAEVRRLVGEGKVVQYLASVVELEAHPTDRPDVMPGLLSAPPPWAGHRSVAQAAYVGILSTSKQQAAARTWWEFAFRPEHVADLIAQSGDVVPIYTGALGERSFEDQAWASGFRAATPVVLSSTVDGFEASIGEFRRTVLGRVNEVLVAGKAPEVALREAQQGLENLASRL